MVSGDGSPSSGREPWAELKVLTSPRFAADGMPPSRPCAGEKWGGEWEEESSLASRLCPFSPSWWGYAISDYEVLHHSRVDPRAGLVRSWGPREVALPTPACVG